MRFLHIVCVTSLVCTFSNIGCTLQPGEEVRANASSEEIGATSEPLTETQQNLIRCDLNPIQHTLTSPAERQQFRRGCHLFFEETFGGNDRTCGTCHLQILANGNPDDNNFDLSIEDVEAAFAEDPHGPLFRELDSDDGMSAAEGGVDDDFTQLRTFANVRIPLPLHSNVTVVDEGSPFVSEDGRTVTVWRSTPTIENAHFFEEDGALMWDGRLETLQVQAMDAILTHFETHLPGGRLPTTQELDDIAFFQRHQFSNAHLRLFAKGGPPREIPQVPEWLDGEYWDSVRRGRNFFVDMPVSSSNPVRGGHCATCHSGPMLNQTNEFDPIQGPGEVLNNNFVPELNALRPPDRRLPEHEFRIVLDHPVYMPEGPLARSPFLPPPGTLLFPPGTVFTARSPDLGRMLTMGNPCVAPGACIIGCPPGGPSCNTISIFRTSTLWGAADSAPYFHDNSAATIEEALQNNYLPLFSITADGLNRLGLDGDAFRLTPEDAVDIANYFKFAFRHQPVLVP